MRQAHTRGMQQMMVERYPKDCGRCTIAIVAEDWIPGMGKMKADLVRAPSERNSIDQRSVAKSFRNLEVCFHAFDAVRTVLRMHAYLRERIHAKQAVGPTAVTSLKTQPLPWWVTGNTGKILLMDQAA